jgi:hypothetical protein
MPFEGIVENLTSDGVEWYSANLLIGVTTHHVIEGHGENLDLQTSSRSNFRSL